VALVIVEDEAEAAVDAVHQEAGALREEEEEEEVAVVLVESRGSGEVRRSLL
jgi:hypothetical protein